MLCWAGSLLLTARPMARHHLLFTDDAESGLDLELLPLLACSASFEGFPPILGMAGVDAAVELLHALCVSVRVLGVGDA